MPVKIDNTSLAEDSVSAKTVFQAKSRRVEEHDITLNEQTVHVKVRAMPNKDLRALIAEHPARRGNTDDALGFNYETFPPHFFAKVYLDPEMSAEEWTDVWNSPDWSPGELSHLIDLAWGVCMKGFDVPFGGKP